ncbi:unnamed protein product, partial [Wuchereria bancrofti]
KKEQKESDKKSGEKESKENEGGKDSKDSAIGKESEKKESSGKKEEEKESGQKEEEREKEEGKDDEIKKDREKEGKKGSEKEGEEKDDKGEGEKGESEKKEEGEKKEEQKKEEEEKKEEQKKEEEGKKEEPKKEEEEKKVEQKKEKEGKKEEPKKEEEEKKAEQKKEEEEQKEVTYDPKELKFTLAGGSLKFTTKNGTGKRQALKIKCSDNFLYRVNPVFSFVEPGAEQTIEVIRQSGNPKIDKLVLIHTPAEVGETDAPALFKKPITYTNFIIPLLREIWLMKVPGIWIEHYERELKNFEEFGDEGEVWFGHTAENRLVKYVSGNEQLSKSCKLIDFGCGNGSLLRALRQEGYSHLCGVDYSEEAVSLARKLADKKCAGSIQIDFRVVDLLSEDINLGKFDAVLDKGTWDALSLSVDRDCRLKKYKANVCKTLRPYGFFIICSCNFSRDELKKQFVGEELSFLEEVPSKNIFEFGGRKGSTTTCMVFQRQ